MIAYILKIGASSSEVYLTDHDQSIVFEENTYTERSLLSVSEIPNSTGVATRTSFSASCPPGSAALSLFNSDPGVIEGTIELLDLSDTSSIWKFRGILGQGKLSQYRYEGELEHIISWRLRNPQKLYWNNISQKASYPSDNGLEHAHRIQSIYERIRNGWRGIDG